MTEVICGGWRRTFTFPRTVTIVHRKAFENMSTASVRLNEGLKTLKENCFSYSRIRRLVLPASVIEVSEKAFAVCNRLRHADLSAARGLRYLDSYAFSRCGGLRQVLLNEGLETIRLGCFFDNRIERITFPHTLRCIGDKAFLYCRRLKQVCLAETALESIGASAFASSGLESFTAPPSLCAIDQHVFSGCESLKYVDLSACLRDEQ